MPYGGLISGSPSTLKLLHYMLIRMAKKRLTVQNPYFLGYQGVVEAAMSTQGRIPPASLDPGVTIADRDNMNNPEVKSLLEPPTAQVGG